MKRSLLLALSLFAIASCGEDKGPEVNIVLDASIADAAPAPDAEACMQTECGDLCVDTATDPLNCGGCGMACQSAGQICSGALPCECPADFIPATLTGDVMAQGGALAGLSFVIGTTFDIVAVVYDTTLETGVEYNLADSLGSLAPPAVVAGYDVDVNNFTAHTAYASVSGTIIFDTLCDTGISGTITSVDFNEVAGITNPAPVANGCTLARKTLSFNYGTCPVILPDAGVLDAGDLDAGDLDAGI